MTNALLDIVGVDDANGEGLFKAVRELLSSKDIPLQNIIGFASDNCSAMLSISNGFQAFIKKKKWHEAFILGCSACHSFALCASHAISQLPSFLGQFLRRFFAIWFEAVSVFSSFSYFKMLHTTENIECQSCHRRGCCPEVKLSQGYWSNGMLLDCF